MYFFDFVIFLCFFALFSTNIFNKVAKELGLNVSFQECDLYSSDPDNTLTVIENFVLADLEDSPDIVNTMSYGVVRAGIKGLLYNALTKDKDNYFAKSVGMKTFGAVVNESLAGGTNTFASSWQSQAEAVQGALASTLVTYGQQE